MIYIYIYKDKGGEEEEKFNEGEKRNRPFQVDKQRKKESEFSKSIDLDFFKTFDYRLWLYY